MYAKISKNKRQKTYKSRRVNRKMGVKPSKAIKQYVKSMISRNIELKQHALTNIVSYTQFPLATFSGTGSGSILSFYNANIGQLFDQISAGTGQGDRIGNVITLKKAVIRGFLQYYENPLVDQLGGDQFDVRIYIGYRLDGTPITGSLLGLFQNGDTNYAPSGQLTDTLSWVNKDLYKVMWSKRFKVGMSTGTVPNNDYPASRYFAVDLCKHGFKNKRVVYNDAGNPPPIDIAPLTIWATCSNADGTPLDLTSVTQTETNARFGIVMNVMFEDA